MRRDRLGRFAQHLHDKPTHVAAPCRILHGWALGTDAAQVVIRIKLPDHGVEVTRVGRDLRQSGTKGFSLAGKLGPALRQARKHVVGHRIALVCGGQSL